MQTRAHTHGFLKPVPIPNDTDNTNTLSNLELTSMLDSIESTLTRTTYHRPVLHMLQQETT